MLLLKRNGNIILWSFQLIIVSCVQRERAKFDFDWLFSIIPTPQLNCGTNDFPNEMNGMWCNNLMPQGSAHNLQECIDICCSDELCEVYQYCSNNTCSVGQCWVGITGSCKKSASGWITRTRSVPAPTPSFIDTYSKQGYDDSNWRQINIPHDYIVGGIYSPNNDPSHGYLPKNISWYRKHFNLPMKWRNSSIFIDFDGIYRYSDIYLNGVYLGHHESGYTSFRYYINHIKPLYFTNNTKENVLAVRVNPILNEGWWYEGGGLYRHCWVTKTNYIHIKPWGVYAGNNVTNVYTNGIYGDAMIDIQTNITYNASIGDTMSVSLQTDIISKSSGQLIVTNIKTGISLNVGDEVFISQLFNVTKPILLWSIAHPELHMVESTILDSNNNILDSVSTTFGFRKAYFDPNGGLYLNDEYVKIMGFCNHQDFGGCGTAVPDRVNRFKVESLQEIGANAWRMSHNPPNIELLDFMDQYGMLVWDENKRFANNSQYLNDQADMINRDKNHPSIIIWSLCNENECLVNDPSAGDVALMFKNRIKSIDNINKRPVSAAMNQGVGDKMSPVLDIQGINYNPNEYDPYHFKHPMQPIISSENCVATTTRNEYQTNATAAHESSYKNVSACWIPVVERKFIIGSFGWSGFDYRGETSPFGWPQISSLFGVFDNTGFKKDDYWYYRSIWQQNNETIIYLFPNDWNQWKNGETVSIWIYSNVNYIDLQLNGKSVSNGLESITSIIPSIYSVVYEPGILAAIGYDINKNEIGNYSITTTDIPYAIQLIAEYPSNTIYSDGQDVALIKVKIVDNNGNVVPYATNIINFDITGNGIIYGVGNGDDSSHESDKGMTRSAFHGLVRVIVQSILNKPGEIKLTATSNGLISKTIVIYTIDSPQQNLYI